MNRFLWERRISVWELPIVTLIIGTIVSQSIIFLSTIIMGKLYSPGQFGVYALIVNIAGVLALFLSRSLETFIVPAGTADEANSIFKKGIRQVVWTSLFTTLVIYLIYLALDMGRLRININYKVVFFSLTLGCLLALYSLSYQLILRELKYKVLASRGPVQNTAIGFFQGICNILNMNNWGLVIGEIIGRVIGLGFLFFNLRTYISKMRNSTEKMRNSPQPAPPTVINFISILFDLLSGVALIVYVNFFFGHWATGQLAMSQKMAVIPILFFGANFAQYILSRESHNRRQGIDMTRGNFDSVVLRLLIGGLIFAVTLFLIGAWTLDLILGDKWAVAGKLISYIAPTLVISFIWNPISSLYYVKGLWSEFLKISALRLLLIACGALVARFLNLSLYHSILLILCLSAFVQTYGIFRLRIRFSIST